MATLDDARKAILNLVVETAEAEAITGGAKDQMVMRQHKADVIRAPAEAHA